MKVLFAFCSPCAASFHRDIVSEKKKRTIPCYCIVWIICITREEQWPCREVQKRCFSVMSLHCIRGKRYSNVDFSSLGKVHKGFPPSLCYFQELAQPSMLLFTGGFASTKGGTSNKRSLSENNYFHRSKEANCKLTATASFFVCTCLLHSEFHSAASQSH